MGLVDLEVFAEILDRGVAVLGTATDLKILVADDGADGLFGLGLRLRHDVLDIVTDPTAVLGHSDLFSRKTDVTPAYPPPGRSIQRGVRTVHAGSGQLRSPGEKQKWSEADKASDHFSP
ncbi:hypothetical protein [Nocardia noduli]|uniref:hypothetical protein n=1 Tax=Nocardia noduli TaxID=2815722 RepID=UPI001C247FA9|nr:hypothetical protein [Nocardia noduli]